MYDPRQQQYNKEEFDTMKARADELEAENKQYRVMIADIKSARVMNYIGATGGGNPSIYYDTNKVETALAGLCDNYKALKENQNEVSKRSYSA